MDLGDRPTPSRAFNYRKPSWNTSNCSVLQKKVSILLGLKFPQDRSVTDTFVETGLEPTTDGPVPQSPPGQAETTMSMQSGTEYREVPFLASMEVDQEKLLREISIFKGRTIDASVLRSGVNLDRYQVADSGTGEGFRLVLQAGQGGQKWDLAVYRSSDEAIAAANELRRFLVRLNTHSEGFHVVEHILLRPSNQATPREGDVPEDFYSFNVSVILPAWSARFHDEMFRRLVEEMVEINCPAHIHPEFHWLEFPAMREFEGFYQQWLAAKAGEPTSAAEVDAASTLLKKCILDARATGRPEKGV
jgi:hypothetical protein